MAYYYTDQSSQVNITHRKQSRFSHLLQVKLMEIYKVSGEAEAGLVAGVDYSAEQLLRPRLRHSSDSLLPSRPAPSSRRQSLDCGPIFSGQICLLSVLLFRAAGLTFPACS